MRKKILYVDVLSPKGHINFNKLQITALSEMGFDIDYGFKEDYAKHLGISEDKVKLRFKNYKFTNGLINRIRILQNLFKLKERLKEENYDAIVLSSFDEIALFCARIKQPIYIINHNNCIGFENSKLKRWIYKKISKIHIPLVMDNASLKLLKDNGIINTIKINHGIIPPYSPPTLPERFNKFNKLIFSPSIGSSDNEIFYKINEDIELKTYIIKNNIGIVIKSNLECNLGENFIVIRSRLSDAEYQSLLCHSSIILLNYPNTFKYRTSGVLLECIANNKNVLVSNVGGLRQYEEIIGINSYYLDFPEFKKKLIYKLKNLDIKLEYKYKNKLKPNFDFLKDE